MNNVEWVACIAYSSVVLGTFLKYLRLGLRNGWLLSSIVMPWLVVFGIPLAFFPLLSRAVKAEPAIQEILVKLSALPNRTKTRIIASMMLTAVSHYPMLASLMGLTLIRATAKIHELRPHPTRRTAWHVTLREIFRTVQGLAAFPQMPFKLS